MLNKTKDQYFYISITSYTKIDPSKKILKIY